MMYAFTAIADDLVPTARDSLFQHAIDTYASETNKVISVWRVFKDVDLSFRSHLKSSSVEEIMKHELLSQRRFLVSF